MSKGPSTRRDRKRERQITFDLNRSTPYVLGKYRKNNTLELEPSNGSNLIMSQRPNNIPQIYDKSATIINVETSRGAAAKGTSAEQGAIPKISRLRDQVVPMDINNDDNSFLKMNELKQRIDDLTNAVGRMSQVMHATQIENKKLREEILPNIIKLNGSGSHQNQISPTASIQSSQSACRNSNAGNPDPYNRIRIDKWGLEFNGNSSKLAVEDFIFRIERFKHQYQVSWDDVMDNFHLFVKGAAEKWYWLFIQTNLVTEWETLKEALLKQYKSTRSSFELMSDLVERKQLPGESIDTFFFAMNEMRSRLNISMPEREMVKLVKKNLREDLKARVYPIAVESVEELRRECVEAEKVFGKKVTRNLATTVHGDRYHRQVNEIVEKPVENSMTCQEACEDVAALETGRFNALKVRNPLVCWNCRQTGHVFMDCPSSERFLFCFKCGKPDVIAPNCSNCSTKNAVRNDGVVAAHRSNQDQTNLK
ncbi:hypothetical protein EVAR_70159_1 [Eumeta japonica]|uniref:CCHC-type domain-containing protein n=1 Tax=Eumeta variegata TaxID=151549 RepID=A0A4C1SBZ0_EUMVA|nr:hypothetical protein EVAR_70159_1 [Eumeta japonica]